MTAPRPDEAAPDWPQGAPDPRAFEELVRREGLRWRRDLPWRRTRDPYAVLVSEVMLQQTQVSRVAGRWERFMALFPTIDALASASTSDVLEQWQGLGYNRRALALKRLADECSSERGGQLPRTEEELRGLPGVGPATAAGVMAFAHDEPAVYLETNVRAVFLQILFPGRDQVPDREIRPLVAWMCPERGVREWYYALLDFGAHLKAAGPNPTRRSAHYAKQGAFEGSRRQKRAALVRIALAEPGITLQAAAAALDDEERAAGRDAVAPDLFADIAADLEREGFFRIESGRLLP